jgi:Alpha/beta hydrolase family
MSSDLILVPGPFVRASSWEPTAKYLREAGYNTQVPDILSGHLQPPSWSAWSSHLLHHISPCDEAVLIGHSSAGPLAADLAGRLQCRCIVIVDGHIPPSQGIVPAVRPAFRDFIQRLAAGERILPIWSRWFSGDAQREALLGLDLLASDPVAFAKFENELLRFPVDWFDDMFKIADWDQIPAGFIQTCAIYDYAVEEAQRRGWPVTKLQGTHLHPMLEPAETGGAIIAMIHQLISGSA